MIENFYYHICTGSATDTREWYNYYENQCDFKFQCADYNIKCSSCKRRKKSYYVAEDTFKITFTEPKPNPMPTWYQTSPNTTINWRTI